MAIPDSTKIYPRSEDKQIVYLKNVITNPNTILIFITLFPCPNEF